MYISSAALIDEGRIIAAAPEERFTRVKKSRAFPERAIEYCLAEAGCSMADVAHVATAWNPGIYMQKFNPLFSGQRRFKAEYLYSVPDNLMNFLPRKQRRIDHVHQCFATEDGELSVYHVTHHRAHAANAFLLSPFETAAIMTADSQGELESATFAVGRGNTIECLESLLHPNSLGVFYAAFTEYLGFRPHSDEWKVMALAAYAQPDDRFMAILSDEVLRLNNDGTFTLNLAFFKDFLHETPNLFTALLVDRFGPPRGWEDDLDERHYGIAAAVQATLERAVFHLLTALNARTGLTDLCVSGGAFMNSVLNGRLLDNTPFDRLFVSSCPDDSGNALGAAYYLHNHILGATSREPLTHNYLGPEFDNDTIAATLRKFGVAAQYVADVESTTARHLADGRIVGWFQGRMEFGQRALGNRSILADPRSPDVKDKVNLAVKYREAFRPFAPAILSEHAAEYFEMNGSASVPFMEKVYPIRAEKRASIPAVVHVDGSGRLQTVERDTNPRFHETISRFKALTDIPIVLNTSFNLNGEPVVCSPEDAIRTFYTCGLDVLVLGNHVVEKNGKTV